MTRAFRFLRAAVLVAAALQGFAQAEAQFSSLNMGMDYRLRGVAIENNDLVDQTRDRLNYNSHNIRFYMTSWLNRDVEASLRLQSIGFWGLEGSTRTPVTRYPRADGTPFVEEAYIHLPHFAWNKVNLILGRQGIVIGDGLLVSDDDLGFNAIRAQADLPFAVDVDGFSAKITEALGPSEDTDLYGLVLGTNRKHNRWELAWIREKQNAGGPYVLAGSTTTAGRVMRQFYDLRLFGNLGDAYYKLEYAMQTGDAQVLAPAGNVQLEGNGQKLELGAQTDHPKWGRFGVRALYASGTGDDPGTTGTDEAFRPTFARRWDGLQRAGYGRHFAATLSDAYDRNEPFSPTATGLPTGYSGIKTMGFGIFSTQGVVWTGSVDYFIYEAMTKPAIATNKDLGAELDAGLTYRYTGFVTFGLGMAYFFPSDAFGASASRATRYTAEAHVHF
jgi:hypothetical protein